MAKFPGTFENYFRIKKQFSGNFGNYEHYTTKIQAELSENSKKFQQFLFLSPTYKIYRNTGTATSRKQKKF